MTKVSIATWNVNSIRARLSILLKWLKKNNPDILLLQELKAQEDDIPRTELEDLNYNFITFGRHKVTNSSGTHVVFSKFSRKVTNYNFST